MQSKSSKPAKSSRPAKRIGWFVSAVGEVKRSLGELDRLRRRSIYFSRSLRLLMVPRLPDRGSVWRTTMIARIGDSRMLP